jgi:NAD(P)-dependent dehydrogenase (short-subunit alcohol dehydrogenase family)
MGLTGRNAVVTGGGAGIGAAIADKLREAGASVVTVDANAATSPTHIADMGGDGRGVADTVLAAHGVVDVIVNNVGMTPDAGFFDTDEDEWDRVMHVNLRGPWFFTKRLVEALVAERRGGSVIFISSLHDRDVSGWPHYSSSKAAVTMLGRELAWALGPHGIRVNVVAPGGIFTSNDLYPDREYPRIPMRRIGLPDDVARAVAALADDDASGYITGARVPVDGGLSLFDWLHDA